jgi:hypothetical protein
MATKNLDPCQDLNDAVFANAAPPSWLQQSPTATFNESWYIHRPEEAYPIAEFDVASEVREPLPPFTFIDRHTGIGHCRTFLASHAPRSACRADTLSCATPAPIAWKRFPGYFCRTTHCSSQ